MSKHTPGPWFIWQELAMQIEGCCREEIDDELTFDSEHSIYSGEPKECTRGRLKGHNKHICDVDAEDFDFDDDEGTSRAEALANARLIAAAPDLLEALQACDEAMSYMSEYDIPLHLPFRVKAAIAKATGGAV